MHKIIITLTTISSRLEHIHLVLKTLISQEFQKGEFEVRLNLSKEPYLLDEGCPILTPEIELLLEENPSKLSIHYGENTGPYRKVLPVLEKAYEGDQNDFLNTLIVTADDDTAYPPWWLRTLYDNYLQYQCVVGFRGRAMCFEDKKPISYKKWTKDISENPSLANVATGKDGIMYSPMHLHPNVRNSTAAKLYAPKADDLWLKVHCLMLGVPTVIINPTLHDEFPSVTGHEPVISLYRSFNQRGGNDNAISDIERYLASVDDLSFWKLCENKAKQESGFRQLMYRSIKGVV